MLACCLWTWTHPGNLQCKLVSKHVHAAVLSHSLNCHGGVMVSLQDSAVFKSAQSQCHDASAGHEQSVAVN